MLIDGGRRQTAGFHLSRVGLVAFSLDLHILPAPAIAVRTISLQLSDPVRTISLPGIPGPQLFPFSAPVRTYHPEKRNPVDPSFPPTGNMFPEERGICFPKIGGAFLGFSGL